ncbi:MAG: phosphoenolpyruvate--protein phosphotransferase [Chloroflexi bacterium]|nr:phosphoenolpyruvate--protein phosphotransferase [Chloroflexota bacterium]
MSETAQRSTTLQLEASDVRLNVRVASREEAIREVAGLLIANGKVAPGYVESMLGREQQANTYLGHGISIPHGMPQDRELIRRTGIAVLQVPDGVTWNPGERVHLVVGIAARSDEHLQVLASLTDVLDDPSLVDRLATTNDAGEIVASLNRRTSLGSAGLGDEFAEAPFVDVTIVGSGGLHARPATMLVEVAGRFASEIRVQQAGREANAKALASILKLGVEGGQTVRLLALGPDADAALAALREAVESGLGEGEAHDAAVTSEGPSWLPVSTARAIMGVAASPGLAIGPVFQFKRARLVVEDRPRERDEEKLRLREALETAREQLDVIHEQVKSRAGSNEAAIFRAHQAMLADPDLLDDVYARIEDGHSAAWSWQRTVETRVSDVQQIGNATLAGRAADLHDVGQRVLRVLAGTEEGEPSLPSSPAILVAENLSPSDTAKLDPNLILGLCTVLGGPTAHTAIIARSLGIPAIVGAGAALLELPDGQTTIVDGSLGALYVSPSEADLASARAAQAGIAQRRDLENESRFAPALLTDGHRVEVVANLGRPSEVEQALQAGAEGVGLLRTELLFVGRSSAPTEEEQYQAYAEMARNLNGLPLIIRTLDIGGDKSAPYITVPAEENPFLGVRGIRLCLRRPDLFRTQLRAIYRASTAGDIKIMFPMVSTLEELREAKDFAESVRQEIGVPPVEIGMMVEVPSAALMADELAPEVDFFSIGTNDLAQYTLAIDRLHPTLGSQVDGLHPAVLRLIQRVVQAGEPVGTWVGVCGGIAGEPLGALILTGLGVAELSMSIPSVAAVKARLRQVSRADTRMLAERALRCSSAAEVRALGRSGGSGGE